MAKGPRSLQSLFFSQAEFLSLLNYYYISKS